jgi:hypothetical protein
MTSHTDLITSQYLPSPLESEVSPTSADKPVRRSLSCQLMGGINYFLGFVIVAAIFTGVGAWACNSASRSTTAADWFLWVSGSDKTWGEYQRDQEAKGNPRLKDKDMTWMQQLFNDAYADNNR